MISHSPKSRNTNVKKAMDCLCVNEKLSFESVLCHLWAFKLLPKAHWSEMHKFQESEKEPKYKQNKPNNFHFTLFQLNFWVQLFGHSRDVKFSTFDEDKFKCNRQKIYKDEQFYHLRLHLVLHVSFEEKEWEKKRTIHQLLQKRWSQRSTNEFVQNEQAIMNRDGAWRNMRIKWVKWKMLSTYKHIYSQKWCKWEEFIPKSNGNEIKSGACTQHTNKVKAGKRWKRRRRRFVIRVQWNSCLIALSNKAGQTSTDTFANCN